MFDSDPPRFSRASRAGWTLVEFLISVALLAVITALGTAMLGRARESGRTSRCVQNLRQIGAASFQYVADHQGWLPVSSEKDHESGKGGWGSGSSVVGVWYWNVAPYLEVPRWSSIRRYLGPQGGAIERPIVFTCPSHGPNEAMPIVFPSREPVSYAPATPIRPERSRWEGTVEIQQPRLREIARPTAKIWLSDSSFPNINNVSLSRWLLPVEDPDAWPRQAFSRHQGGGNALFFDGHVEWIAVDSIIHAADPTREIRRLFDPYVD